jgi:uncharacterized protein with GYD domain
VPFVVVVGHGCSDDGANISDRSEVDQATLTGRDQQAAVDVDDPAGLVQFMLNVGCRSTMRAITLDSLVRMRRMIA